MYRTIIMHAVLFGPVNIFGIKFETRAKVLDDCVLSTRQNNTLYFHTARLNLFYLAANMSGGTLATADH